MLSDTSTKPAPRLIDQVRSRLRVLHYSIRTEETYVHWILRFIRYHDKRHPKEMGNAEIEDFLSHLATKGKVAASTRNQDKSALLFLYREVLEIDLPWLRGISQAKANHRVRMRLSRPFPSVCYLTPGFTLLW